MPTKRIWRRKVKLGRRVQQLSLRHYLIDSFLKKFNQAAEETIALNRRIAELVRNGATPKGEETGPAEVEKFRRDLKEHERFLGRKATHVVGAVTQIAKWKDCIIAARNRMVEGHLGLVAPIASRYANRGVELSDLLAEGNLGLVKAVEEFDYRRGLKFSAHAAYWIRKTIARAVADQTLSPRLPAHVVNAVEKVAEVRREFVQTQGREPSVGEIAERLSTAKETIQALISISQPDVSLDRLDGEGEPSLPGDFIRDAEASPLSRAVRDSILGEKLELALKVLTKREERVLRLRFGLGDGYPRTLEEVGQIFNISRERVRQIEAAALDKLRRPLSLRELKVLQELL
jgi:RNA polymerase sigma factor (sigma-70 family)